MSLTRLLAPTLPLALLATALAALGSASAVTDDGARTATDAPTIHTPYAVPMDRAVRLRSDRVSPRKRPWPVRQRVGVTVEDTDRRGVPAQQLRSARIVQDLPTGTVSASVTLRAAPTAATDSMVLIGLGKVSADGDYCQYPGEATVYWSAYGSNATGLLRDGAKMTLLPFPADVFAQNRFNCAFAETWQIEPEGSEQWQELLSGRGAWSLKTVYDTPTLKLRSPKSVKTVGSRWKTVKVKVRNKSPRVTAPKVKVTVKARGVTATTVKLGKIKPGATKTAKVRLRTSPGAARKAKVVVRTLDVTKKRALRLR